MGQRWVVVMTDGKTVLVENQRNIVDGIIRGCCEAGRKPDDSMYYPHDVVKVYVKGAGEVRLSTEA